MLYLCGCTPYVGRRRGGPPAPTSKVAVQGQQQQQQQQQQQHTWWFFSVLGIAREGGEGKTAAIAICIARESGHGCQPGNVAAAVSLAETTVVGDASQLATATPEAVVDRLDRRACVVMLATPFWQAAAGLAGSGKQRHGQWRQRVRRPRSATAAG